MSFANLLVNWLEREGDPSALTRWIPVSAFESCRGDLTELAKSALARFLENYYQHVPIVSKECPEFTEWLSERGNDFIRESLKHLRVREPSSLLDVVGLIESLTLLVDGASDTEGRRFWLIEVLAQLRAGLEDIGLLDLPATYRMDLDPGVPEDFASVDMRFQDGALDPDEPSPPDRPGTPGRTLWLAA